jgi:hypothetical protein
MNARLMAASMVGGFALAALLFSTPFSGQLSAQSAAASHGKHGLFSTLKVGQMVQLWVDNLGQFVRTYEDLDAKPLMMHKVKEIGSDYIVLEFEDTEKSGSLFEIRIPVYHVTEVVHVGKSTKPATSTDDAKPEKKATGPDKKPGMTKKKS